MRLPRETAALGSALLLAAAFVAAAPGLQPAQRSGGKAAHRANELTLAGLRPGRDTRATAFARYHKPYGPNDEKTATWRDLCRGREMRLDFGDDDVVETVSLAVLTGPHYDCHPGTPTMPPETWRTGHGLSLGELRERVTAVYGEPDSQGPSTKQGDESDFFYYAFDWAGSDVPQVLEVTCEAKSGRVVQITLAAQSL